MTDPEADDALVLALDHVQLAMPAGGEAKARAFYCDALGLRETIKPVSLAPRGGCWFEAGSLRLHLGIDPDFRPARKAHPAFLVRALAPMVARLASVGYQVRPDTPLEGCERVFVDDPFGNRIELLQRGV